MLHSCLYKHDKILTTGIRTASRMQDPTGVHFGPQAPKYLPLTGLWETRASRSMLRASFMSAVKPVLEARVSSVQQCCQHPGVRLDPGTLGA